MAQLKYLYFSTPFLIIAAILHFHRINSPPLVKNQKKLTSQVIGKWIVGRHQQFNDADTLNLQEAIDHALNGDTILLRPGNYEIHQLPQVNLAIRGLSGNPEEFTIDLKKSIAINNHSLQLENLFLINSFEAEFGILINDGEINLNNVKVKFTNTKKDFLIGRNSRFSSQNNHFIGTNKNTSIFLSENAKFSAENNKFIKFKNAIETQHQTFTGIIELKDIEMSNCLSSAIYLHGGNLIGKNISISKCASGLIISGESNVTLDQLYVIDNNYYALDVINGGKIKVDLFKFERNNLAGIRATGKSSILQTFNGEISQSQSGLIAEEGASINGKNVRLNKNLTSPKLTKEDGEINIIE